jgi:hypothetical protein
MELLADGLGKRTGNVAIVKIQDIHGEQNKGGDKKAAGVGFLGHLRMLAECEVDRRYLKVKRKKSRDLGTDGLPTLGSKRHGCPPD